MSTFWSPRWDERLERGRGLLPIRFPSVLHAVHRDGAAAIVDIVEDPVNTHSQTVICRPT